jgi:arsenate reductase (glutaredoxin)
MTITVYHHPTCSNVGGTLDLIRAAGFEPLLIDYQATPPSVEELARLIHAAGLSGREAIRAKEAVFAELGLDDPALDDGALLRAMAEHPVLINRPFVETPLGVRLCRPPETVKAILPAA